MLIEIKWMLVDATWALSWVLCGGAQSWCAPSSLMPSGPPMMAEPDASIDFSLVGSGFW